MPEALELLLEVEQSVTRLPATTEWFAGLDDEQLMQAHRILAGIARRVSASTAVGAGEIAHRSRPDLGYAGLAQRTGARTPESLVQQLTGSTGREAATLVRVGTVMQEAETTPVMEPVTVDGDQTADEVPWDGTGTAWLAPVGRAVAAGTLPVGAADAIRAGLGTPSDTVTVDQLTFAAQRLVDEAAEFNTDQLFKRARNLRDEIDAAGVTERERARHAQRSFRVFKRADGMIKGDFLLAPESGGAEVLIAFQAVTSPRRGGPRFVDAAEQERARRILDDERSTEQIQADAFVEFVRHGVNADPGTLVGSSKPQVRILVTNSDLNTAAAGNAAGNSDANGKPGKNGKNGSTSTGTTGNGSAGNGTGTASDVTGTASDVTGTAGRAGTRTGAGTGAGFGVGFLEGHPDAVSMGTVERAICATGTVPIHFDDDGACINVGREQRLFTARQRIGLAARDGGCRFPGCDRPPSWCEAHHITQWLRDSGRTDLADGILLCRHHHLLIHNNNWHIRRIGAEYFLIPPRERDPNQTPIPMPSKSLPLRHLTRHIG